MVFAHSCKLCGNLVNKHRIYQHYKLLHMSSRSFPCPEADCEIRCRNVNQFAIHLCRNHSVKRTSLTRKLTCSYCRLPHVNIFQSVSQLLTHLRKMHIEQNHKLISCCFQNCSFTTKVSGSWKSHISRNHDTASDTVSPKFVVEKNATIMDHNLDAEDLDLDSSIDFNEQPAPERSLDFSTADLDESMSANQFEKILALFFLKMQVVWHIPEYAIPEIFDTFLELHGASIRHSQQLMAAREEIGQDGTSPDLISQFANYRCSLSTNHRRSNYFKRNLPYVAPIEMTIPGYDGKKYPMIYVPILQDLAVFFESTDVLEKFDCSTDQQAGQYSDFESGSYSKNIKFSTDQPYNLKIFLYNDDWTAINPIGIYARRRKLCAFYYTIGNLPRKYRGCLQGIRLLALCPSITVKACGLVKILDPLLFDIKILETEGLFVQKLNQVIYGTLACICADNLAAHMLGGYFESFGPSVSKSCRYCLIDSKDVQNDCIDVRNIEVRNEFNYRQQVHMISTGASTPSEYGIKFDSPFNRLNLVHITRMLPADLSHDLGEGILAYKLKYALVHFITTSKYFTYDYFIERLKTFKFKIYDRRNITDFVPPDFSKSSCSTIGGNATKNLYLLRFLPLLVGHKVPEDDIVWRCIVLLKRIVEYAYAEHLDDTEIEVFRSMIANHRYMYRKAFPHERLKPKHHFVEHYPDLIRAFGPLVHYQTIRFESKHAFFKRIIHHTMNFKNLCGTLANRHQLWLAYLMTSESYFNDDVVCSSESVVYISDLPLTQQIACHAKFHSEDRQLSYKEVTICGQRYRPGMFLIHTFIDGHPCYCKILYIFFVDNQVTFLCNHYNSFFNDHLMCYELACTNKVHIMDFDKLECFYPLHGYMVNSKLWIAPKFHTCE